MDFLSFRVSTNPTEGGECGEDDAKIYCPGIGLVQDQELEKAIKTIMASDKRRILFDLGALKHVGSARCELSNNDRFNGRGKIPLAQDRRWL